MQQDTSAQADTSEALIVANIGARLDRLGWKLTVSKGPDGRARFQATRPAILSYADLRLDQLEAVASKIAAECKPVVVRQAIEIKRLSPAESQAYLAGRASGG